jgi:hypothetical protein
MDSQPIFIAGSPRSGTTMIAGLLKLHGVWVGESRVTRDPKSNSLIGTENVPIKRTMNRQFLRIDYKNRMIPFPSPEELQKIDYDKIWDVIVRVVPEEGQWLYKSAGLLILYVYFNGKFPDARWVFPRREPQLIVDSIKRHAYMQFHSDTMAFVKYVLKRQEEVAACVKHSMFLPTKPIANLDMDFIQEYFDFCGVEMDENIVKDFVKPEMMH